MGGGLTLRVRKPLHLTQHLAWLRDNAGDSMALALTSKGLSPCDSVQGPQERVLPEGSSSGGHTCADVTGEVGSCDGSREPGQTVAVQGFLLLLFALT